MSKVMRVPRRAVSPVIATVILIAVAVALGIAVAVWAGALTGGLQRNDRLIVLSVGVAAGKLLLSISNQSPNPVSVSQISFNDMVVAPANISGSYTSIPSGTTSLLTLTVTAQSDITYPLTLWLTSGAAYPVAVNWP